MPVSPLPIGPLAPIKIGFNKEQGPVMNEHQENIRRRAYEIWEQEGRPHGQDMKHWLQAFKEFGARVDAATKPTVKVKSAKPRAAAKSAAEKPATKKTKAAGVAIAASSEDKPRRSRSPKSVTTH